MENILRLKRIELLLNKILKLGCTISIQLTILTSQILKFKNIRQR